jgi:hypothetical protein
LSEPIPIRSYQRIFRPDRRIHAIDGRPIPIPGGVPLRWLGYAAATALLVVVLSGRSRGLVVVLALLGSGAARRERGGRAAAVVASFTLVAVPVAGWLLAGLDWPLRFVVVPALVATLATQPTPDGRSAMRHVLSRLLLQLRGGRRSVGRPLPADGASRAFLPRLRVAHDEHGPSLRRARVHGPARVDFAEPVSVAKRRLRRGVVVRTLPRRRRRNAAVVQSLELPAGWVAEVRP